MPKVKIGDILPWTDMKLVVEKEVWGCGFSGFKCWYNDDQNKKVYVNHSRDYLEVLKLAVIVYGSGN